MMIAYITSGALRTGGDRTRGTNLRLHRSTECTYVGGRGTWLTEVHATPDAQWAMPLRYLGAGEERWRQSSWCTHCRTVEAPPRWQTRAACRDHDPDLWFPVPGREAAYRPARRICHGCPVRADCLDYAQRNGLHDGMWGGLTPTEREPEVTKRRRAS